MNLERSADVFFDEYAHDFDSIYGGAERGPLGRFLDRTLRKSMLLRYQGALQGCSPSEGKTILDVGCGPGHYSIALAKQGAKKVVGIDFADEMLRISTDRAKREGVSDRCEFVNASLEDFQASEKFNFSIVCGVMDYIAEPKAFIGKVMDLTEEKAFFSFPDASGILARIRAHRYKKRTPLYLYREADLRQMLEERYSGRFTFKRLARDFFVSISSR